MYNSTIKIDIGYDVSKTIAHPTRPLVYALVPELYKVLVIDTSDNSISDRINIDTNSLDIAIDFNSELLFSLSPFSLISYDISSDSNNDLVNYVFILLSEDTNAHLFFNPVDNNLYVSRDGETLIYDPETLENTLDLTSSMQTTISKFAMSDSSQYVDQPTTTRSSLGYNSLYVSMPEENSFLKYSLYPEQLESTVAVGMNPENFIISKSTNTAYISNYDSESIGVVDLSAETYSTIPAESGIYDLAIDEEHDILYYINNKTDECVVLNLNSLQVLTRIKLPEFPVKILLDSQHSKVYISSRDFYGLTVIDTYDFTSINVDLPFQIDDMSLDSNGQILYIASTEISSVFKLNLIDYTRRRLSTDFLIAAPSALEFDDDANKLYVVSAMSGFFTTIDTIKDVASMNLSTFHNPHKIQIDQYNNLIYVSHRLMNKVSVIERKTLEYLRTMDIDTFSSDIALNNAGTTTPAPTTTVAPELLDVTLSIDSSNNYQEESYVVFYGQDGDTLNYTFIPIAELSSPISISEILIFHATDGMINRITLPFDYIEDNIPFTLTTSSGSSYSSSFGSGTDMTSYRRIDLP